MLSRLPDGAYVRYQHVDLPWPFQDRQWVIHCKKNPALARRSNGRIWEHHWSLQADGQQLLRSALDSGRLPDNLHAATRDAIYLPANRGAWIVFELDAALTLVVAFVDVDFGGRVPDSLLRTFTQRQLKSGFKRIRDTSTRVDTTYMADPVVHDGFGLPISVDAALAAGAAWPSALR
jgi:plasmid stability protein